MPPVTSELPVDGASVTTFDRFGDSRGYFNELYNEQKYDESLQKDWKQVSFSSSQKHAMRGLHCSPHGKFITCVRGAFYDVIACVDTHVPGPLYCTYWVIADFREDSPTFGRWCGVLLTEHNKKQVYVPPNCGHGFFTIEDNTCALYLQQGCFNPVNEKDNHPLDPMFNVQWPVPQGVVPEMSGKDTAAPTLAVRRPHLTGMKPRGRILIIGASGQVGGALMEAFGPENCIGTYSNTKIKGMIPFDMAKCATNPQLATDLIETVYPTAVLICAGFTWVDGCENDQLKANYMNNAGPAVLAAAAAKVGARTVWYSTDYVFDGGYKQGAATSGQGPYSETDPVAPLNVYGASKLAGEKALLAADPTALAIRTNVVYGPEGVGKNFIYQLTRKLAAGEAMNVPSDQVLGRTDFGHAVVDALNARPGATAKPLDKALIKPVTTTNAGQAALRPLDSGLKLDKLSAALPGWKPRTVKEAINDWLDNPMGLPLGQ